MPVSNTAHIIENPTRNPNAEQGNISNNIDISDNPKHVAIINPGANIIAIITAKNTDPPKIILIAFIYLIF